MQMNERIMNASIETLKDKLENVIEEKVLILGEYNIILYFEMNRLPSREVRLIFECFKHSYV